MKGGFLQVSRGDVGNGLLAVEDICGAVNFDMRRKLCEVAAYLSPRSGFLFLVLRAVAPRPLSHFDLLRLTGGRSHKNDCGGCYE